MYCTYCAPCNTFKFITQKFQDGYFLLLTCLGCKHKNPNFSTVKSLIHGHKVLSTGGPRTCATRFAAQSANTSSSAHYLWPSFHPNCLPIAWMSSTVQIQIAHSLPQEQRSSVSESQQSAAAWKAASCLQTLIECITLKSLHSQLLVFSWILYKKTN